MCVVRMCKRLQKAYDNRYPCNETCCQCIYVDTRMEKNIYYHVYVYIYIYSYHHDIFETTYQNSLRRGTHTHRVRSTSWIVPEAISSERIVVRPWEPRKQSRRMEFSTFDGTIHSFLWENGGFMGFNGMITLWLCQNSFGKSPCLMGQSTINGHFQ